MLALLVSAAAFAADTAPQMPPVLLKMIRDQSVHQELGLSASQIDAVYQAHAEVDPDWWRSRIKPAAEQRQELQRLTSQLRSRLRSILDASQLKRLRQLERQGLGTRMVLLDDVVQTLGLSAGERAELAEQFVRSDRESAQIQKQQMQGELEPAKAQAKLTDLKTQERRELIGMLSAKQRAQLGQLTGEPFDFSKIRRAYPLAPEFSGEGATWLQEGPLRLEELRGKVVAVHFYAFQCINCKRNFPHYKAWHQDYADEGLVVVGIQTPETSAERDVQRVDAAMKNDNFKFPVLMDGKSTNWQAWGNTMWPTVYLIDKQGFIRRWWQGEMNWKGTPGEQQMRETIEQLLAEEG